MNQDRFIQRAIEAANAYSSILRAVQAAEGAASRALQQAGHTWAVRPCPCPQSLPSSSRWVGMKCVLSPCLQMVVQQGLAPRARELRANSSALEEAVLREQQRLGRGECLAVSRLCRDPQPLSTGVGVCALLQWQLPCMGTLLPTGSACPPWEPCKGPLPSLAL